MIFHFDLGRRSQREKEENEKQFDENDGRCCRYGGFRGDHHVHEHDHRDHRQSDAVHVHRQISGVGQLDPVGFVVQEEDVAKGRDGFDAVKTKTEK